MNKKILLESYHYLIQDILLCNGNLCVNHPFASEIGNRR